MKDFYFAEADTSVKRTSRKSGGRDPCARAKKRAVEQLQTV